MVRVYLAGPMFCEAELEYNRSVRDRLAEWGIETVLPQECGAGLTEDIISDPAGLLEAAPGVFLSDLDMIDSCDILVINLDGRVPDEGACIELGYAYAKGKPVFGLKTDVRVSERGVDNLMIAGMLKGRTASDVRSLASLILKDREEGNVISERHIPSDRRRTPER